MALEINKTAVEAEVVDTVAVPKLSIELARLNRLHIFGALFESGKVYSLSVAQAEKLLAVEHDEVPAFKRYKGKVVTRQALVEAPVFAESVDLTDLTIKDSAPKRIEIGTDEELRELGLLGDEDGDEAGDVSLD